MKESFLLLILFSGFIGGYTNEAIEKMRPSFVSFVLIVVSIVSILVTSVYLLLDCWRVLMRSSTISEMFTVAVELGCFLIASFIGSKWGRYL